MKADPEGMRILREWDVEAARARFARLPLGHPVADDVVEAGMHKARLMVRSAFTEAQALESTRWLLAHGYRLP